MWAAAETPLHKPFDFREKKVTQKHGESFVSAASWTSHSLPSFGFPEECLMCFFDRDYYWGTETVLWAHQAVGWPWRWSSRCIIIGLVLVFPAVSRGGPQQSLDKNQNSTLLLVVLLAVVHGGSAFIRVWIVGVWFISYQSPWRRWQTIKGQTLTQRQQKISTNDHQYRLWPKTNKQTNKDLLPDIFREQFIKLFRIQHVSHSVLQQI